MAQSSQDWNDKLGPGLSKFMKGITVNSLISKTNYWYILLSLSVLALVPTAVMVAETLNVDALINTNAMFANANVLIAALGGIVLVIIGFKLALLVIRFVLGIFDSFRL